MSTIHTRECNKCNRTFHYTATLIDDGGPIIRQDPVICRDCANDGWVNQQLVEQNIKFASVLHACCIAIVFVFWLAVKIRPDLATENLDPTLDRILIWTVASAYIMMPISGLYLLCLLWTDYFVEVRKMREKE